MSLELRVEPGTFLCAAEALVDSNFARAVVLICEHGDEGAFGLIVNRPTQFDTTELLPEHEVLGKIDFPICQGGPVGLDTLNIVHRVPACAGAGLQLLDDLWWGGDLDAVAEHLERERIQGLLQVRLIMGYAGWGEGQLDAELAEGAWIPAPGSAAQLFESDPRTLWDELVRAMDDGAGGDPCLN